MKGYFPTIVVVLLIMFKCGCDTEIEQGMTQPQINLFMAPALARLSPTRVKLSITDSTGIPIEREKTLTDEARSVTFDKIEIEQGMVKIEIKVFYDGLAEPVQDTKTVEVTRERNVFNFSLDPPDQLAVGIDSEESFPIPQGEEFSIYVYIKNVEDLFGAGIGLQFDDTYISPTKIQHNRSFWGEPGTDFIAIPVSSDQISPVPLLANELEIGWTRLKSPKTQHKKEKLVTITFLAKQATPPNTGTEISFIVDEKVFKLKDKDNKDVKEFHELKSGLPQRKYIVEIQ